jgi:hypothetical protein
VPELTAARFARLREVRATDPQAVARILERRQGRSPLGAGDRIMIVAADHPARGALGIGSDANAMADRYDLLERLAAALSHPGVTGVLGTADILEDLAILGLLEGKIAVGSMNRGGLRGASFEMDDRFTGYDVDGMVRARVDFAKLLLRIDLTDAATVATLEASARAVSACAAAGLPVMLEPFMSTRTGTGIANDLSTDAVIKSVAIAAGLGTSSAYTWLKLPVVDDMERVMASTTLPTLLLGGEPTGDLDGTFDRWRQSLALPGVHGLVVGRTLLYPPDGDVAGAVDTAASLVHAAPSN